MILKTKMPNRESLRSYVSRYLHSFYGGFSLKNNKSSIARRHTSGTHATHYLPSSSSYHSSRKSQKTLGESLGFGYEKRFLFRELFHDRQGIFFLTGLFLLFSTISIGYYWIALSPYFDVAPSNVIIESRDAFIDINQAYDSLEGVYSRKIYGIDEKALRKSLERSQKNIANIDIDTLYPNGIRISISSQKPRAKILIPQSDRSLFLSESGVIMAQQLDREFSEPIGTMTLVTNEKGNISPGKHTLDPIMMRSIELLFGYISSKDGLMKGESIKDITLLEQEREIHIKLESGLTVLLLSDKSFADQISNFDLFIYTTGKQTQEAIYVDMRIPKRVFVCKGVSICSQNLSSIYPRHYAR